MGILFLWGTAVMIYFPIWSLWSVFKPHILLDTPLTVSFLGRALSVYLPHDTTPSSLVPIYPSDLFFP